MGAMDRSPHCSTESDLKDQKKDISPDRASDNAVKEAPSPADTIPNGGLIAWLQVVGSFFLFFNSWLVCSLSNITLTGEYQLIVV